MPKEVGKLMVIWKQELEKKEYIRERREWEGKKIGVPWVKVEKRMDRDWREEIKVVKVEDEKNDVVGKVI